MAEIDVGSAATARTNTGGVTGWTFAFPDNPANDSGVLDTVEIWLGSNATGLVVGVAYNTSGNDFTFRDWATIGSVAAGSKQTITGLSIDVESADIIGAFMSAGALRISLSGVYYYYGQKQNWIDGNSHTFQKDTITLLYASLYATGETAAVGGGALVGGSALVGGQILCGNGPLIN